MLKCRIDIHQPRHASGISLGEAGNFVASKGEADQGDFLKVQRIEESDQVIGQVIKREGGSRHLRLAVPSTRRRINAMIGGQRGCDVIEVVRTVARSMYRKHRVPVVAPGEILESDPVYPQLLSAVGRRVDPRRVIRISGLLTCSRCDDGHALRNPHSSRKDAQQSIGCERAILRPLASGESLRGGRYAGNSTQHNEMMPCRPLLTAPHRNHFSRVPRFARPPLSCGRRSLSGYRLESRGKPTDERPFVTLRSVFSTANGALVGKPSAPEHRLLATKRNRRAYPQLLWKQQAHDTLLADPRRMCKTH